MAGNLLKNGGFEADWSEEKSHWALVFPVGADPHFKELGNVFTPPGWLTWFRHEAGVWDQPEVTDMHASVYPERVCEGEKAIKLFTFQRRHDAGLMQQVTVEPGVRLRLTAKAHAWSNHPLEGYEWCTDKGDCSAGVGQEAAFILQHDVPPLNSDPWNDAISNFMFTLGIDPTGGTNPFAETVVWGQGAYIYNEYASVPEVEVVAQAEKITVFLRSRTLWPFKHSDAYWDNVELTAMYGCRYSPETPLAGEQITIEGLSHELVLAGLEVWHESGNPVAVELEGESATGTGWHIRTWLTEPVEWKGKYTMVFTHEDEILLEADFHIPDGPPAPEPPPECWGGPRVQYSRVYVLLPQNCGPEWAVAAVEGGHGRRLTVGYSADDAGLGALNDKQVLAVNPHLWPDGLTAAWYDEHYPGTDFVIINADTPEQLKTLLELPNAHE